MTYSTHILRALYRSVKHLNGLLEVAHGFKDHYDFEDTSYTAKGIEARLRDKAENVVYKVTIEVEATPEVDPQFLPEKF